VYEQSKSSMNDVCEKLSNIFSNVPLEIILWFVQICYENSIKYDIKDG